MATIPSSLTHLRYKIRPYDFFAAAIAPLLAMLLRDPGFFDRTAGTVPGVYTVVALGASAVALAYFDVRQIMSRYLAVRDLMRIVKAAGAAVAMTLIVIFSVTALEEIPRSMPALHFAVLCSLWAGPRIVRAHWLGRSAAPNWRGADEGIILVGANSLSSLYLQMLKTLPGRRPRVLAILDDNARLHGRSIDECLVLGSIESADALMKEFAVHGVNVDRIIVASADPQEEADILRRLIAVLGDEVQVESLVAILGLQADAGGLRADAVRASGSDAYDAPNVQFRSVYWRARRLSDIIGATVAILALSPLFILGFLLARIDVGSPVIFWQERTGRRGKKIKVHKFRTLRSPLGPDGRLLSDAERLSTIGRFMRALRLDELPQLLDVVRGHMSLIGPRPLLPVDLPQDPAFRLSVRPGLTGWAQVHGGKAVTAEDKAALDEWYICHASFLLDLQIVWLTVRVVVSKRDVLHSERIEEALAFQSRTARRRRESALPTRRTARVSATAFSEDASCSPGKRAYPSR